MIIYVFQLLHSRSLFFCLLVTCTAVSNMAAQAGTEIKQTKYVVGVQTDTLFANKTTVYTKNGISDAKVLEEITGDYSLGDEVRITVATPPKPMPEKVVVPIKERVVIESKAPKTFPPSVFTIEQVLLSESVLPVGSIIRTEHFQFAKDAATLDPSSYAYLDNVYKYLTSHPLVIVEVGGHTNMLPAHEYCLTLSLGRAKAVVSYLTGKGIESSRLKARGYGKTQPLVTTNTETAHKLNQRVEFKVLQNN